MKEKYILDFKISVNINCQQKTSVWTQFKFVILLEKHKKTKLRNVYSAHVYQEK